MNRHYQNKLKKELEEMGYTPIEIAELIDIHRTNDGKISLPPGLKKGISNSDDAPNGVLLSKKGVK